MLLQRPINMRQLGLSNVLSGDETAYMRQMATERFGSIMQVLKSMPRPMLLVFRNINTVRSINITLGAPVDRYFVMAKRSVGVNQVAVKSLLSNDEQKTFELLQLVNGGGLWSREGFSSSTNLTS